MNKFFEVVVELSTPSPKGGKEKKTKEAYLCDAMSVTEAEARVVKDFEDSGISLDYKVVQVKESRIIRVVE